MAQFARASLGRVLLVQFVVAALAAAAVTWFFWTAWFPAVSAAIEHLPQEGAIKAGQLFWGGPSPQLLADNRSLAFAVDLRHTGQVRSPAHFQVEFGQADARICSLLGCVQAAYPKSAVIPVNLPELKPWWGAWAPMLLAVAAVAVTFGVLISWAALASLYWLPGWLLGFYYDRKLTLSGSWKVASAALMPGALALTAAIVLYGLGYLDLVRFVAAWGLHLVLGWVYLGLGALASPKREAALQSTPNPFTIGSDPPSTTSEKQAEPDSPNPFGPGRG